MLTTQPHSRLEQTRNRAYELYLERGGAPGFEFEDWLTAERQIVESEDAMIDEASEESFPASDPPAF